VTAHPTATQNFETLGAVLMPADGSGHINQGASTIPANKLLGHVGSTSKKLLSYRLLRL
jgi:hypothetical protein